MGIGAWMPVRQRQQPLPLKYELRREGDFYRIIALRKIASAAVEVGARGGLMRNDGQVSQRGDSWIGTDVMLVDDASVIDHAQVTGSSVLSGLSFVRGTAYVCDSELSGHTLVTDAAKVIDCSINAHQNAVEIRGSTHIEDSHIEPAQGHRSRITLDGGIFRNAHIRCQAEALAFRHQVHGWLTAFRHQDGCLRYMIGCQLLESHDELRELAIDYQLPPHEMAMLEGFITMVQEAQAGWVSDSQSVEEPVAAIPVGEPVAPVIPPEARLLDPTNDIGN